MKWTVTGWWHLFSLLLLQQCAVEFEIQAFSAESQDAKIRKRWVSAWSLRCSPSTTFTFKQTQNCSWVEENKSFEISVLYLIICALSSAASNRSMVKLMLRKVQYAPEGEGVAPSVETTRDFVMSDKPLHVKASLDKEVRCCTNTQNTTWFWHFLPAHTKTFSSCRKERTSFQYQHPKSKNSPDQKTHHTPASQMKKLIYEFCIMITKSSAFYIPLISTLKRKLFLSPTFSCLHAYHCRAAGATWLLVVLISRNPLLLWLNGACCQTEYHSDGELYREPINMWMVPFFYRLYSDEWNRNVCLSWYL